MARTFGGLLFYDASQLNFTSTGGTVTYARNAGPPTYTSLNFAVSTTAFLQLGLADVKRPFFNFPSPIGAGTIPVSNELQEVFGTAAGGPGNPMGPGFSGTPALAWGISVIDVFAVYSVTTAALTSATLAVIRNPFVENTAVVSANIIAATGIALTTTATADSPHVSKVSAAQPLNFETLDNTDVFAELAIVTPGTGTCKVFGIGLHVAVEYS